MDGVRAQTACCLTPTRMMTRPCLQLYVLASFCGEEFLSQAITSSGHKPAPVCTSHEGLPVYGVAVDPRRGVIFNSHCLHCPLPWHGDRISVIIFLLFHGAVERVCKNRNRVPSGSLPDGFIEYGPDFTDWGMVSRVQAGACTGGSGESDIWHRQRWRVVGDPHVSALCCKTVDDIDVSAYSHSACSTANPPLAVSL